jgi:hypothetical protein
MSRNGAQVSSQESREIELRDFEESCDRGEMAVSGRILYFEKRNYLKRRTKPSEIFRHSHDSTRAASLVDVIIDETEAMSPEDEQIFNAMPNHGRSTFRVKEIKYGNYNAMWEVMSSQLYALTGMRAPDNRLMKMQPKKDEVLRLDVASPIVKGYQDLGDFLIGGDAWRLVNVKELSDTEIDAWQKAEVEIKRINRISQEGSVTAQEKLDRLKAMEVIYNFLPAYFHNEIEKAFAASKFIGNWDFANFSLANIGVRFMLDSKDSLKVVKVESVFVDFGNSGVIGFGGKPKSQSFDKANNEAKPKSKNPSDYDPRLTFSENEKNFMLEIARNVKDVKSWEEFCSDEKLYRSVISNITEVKIKKDSEDEKLVKSILFKNSHHIFRDETSLELSQFQGMLTVSDLPRNLPFARFLRGVIRDKDAELQDENPYPYQDSEIEMAYRFSLIPDEAIIKVITKWNLAEFYSDLFPCPPELDHSQYTTAGLVEIFCKRKKNLIALIPKEVLNDWVVQNKAKAISAQIDVELAIEQRVGSGIFKGHSLVKRNSLTTSSDVELTGDMKKFSTTIASVIEAEIKAFVKGIDSIAHIQEKEQRLQNLRAELPLASSLLGEGSKIVASVKEDIAKKSEDLQQQVMQIKINFLKQNIKKWCRGFDLDPSHNPFDLEKISKIYRVSHNIAYRSEEDQHTTPEESQIRNRAIYEENAFVYQKFMSILDRLIPPPSKMVKKSSEAGINSARLQGVPQFKQNTAL